MAGRITNVALADKYLTDNTLTKYSDADWDRLSDAAKEAVMYHAPGPSGYSSASGSGSSGSGGSGGRSGGSSGGGTRKVNRPLNLTVYKRGRYDNSGLRSRAELQADARNREAYAASGNSRRSANTRYENALREYALNQQRDTETNENQRQSALAGMNNTALNRGMGYGQGLLQTTANMNTGYAKSLNDLLNTYAMQRANALADRDSIYANMDEQDRVTAANRQALIDEVFGTLDDSAWQRYLGTEGLRQDEVSSENARRQALWQSLT